MTSDQTQRIAARIEGRKLCETIFDMVAEEARALQAAHGRAASESFWENFRTAFEGHFPASATPADEHNPMSDVQARAFGERAIPFGQHKGRRVDEVPMDYLCWLADSPEDFKGELRRYLRSNRLQREQDQSA